MNENLFSKKDRVHGKKKSRDQKETFKPAGLTTIITDNNSEFKKKMYKGLTVIDVFFGYLIG